MRDRTRSIATSALALSFFLFQVAVSEAQAIAPTPPIVPIRPVPTDTVVVQIYESTFNKLAAAALPVTFSGHYTYSVSVCIPGTHDCGSTDICSSDWVVTVTQIQFAIAPSGIRLTGIGNASWCHVSVGIELDTTANVALQTNIAVSTASAAPSLQSATPVNPSSSTILIPLPTQTSIQVTVSPTDVQPVFNIPGYTVPLPFYINIAPVLNLPAIPLTPAPVTLSTTEGTMQLQLVPSQFALSLRDHYLELQSTVQLQ